MSPPRRFARILISCAAACLAAGAGPARATNGHWQPPNIVPTTATTASVFAAIDADRGTTAPDALRVETYDVVAGSVRTRATAAIRALDFAIQAPLGSMTYRSGRSQGRHWRQRPNGISYRVGADTQGDSLDRWPLAVLGFDRADCTAIAETRDHTQWVLEDRPASDSPHWFFVDERSGAIVREVVREGSGISEFAFSNAQTRLGVRRPMAWTVKGDGVDESVTVASVAAIAPPDEVLALPPQGTLDPVNVPAGTVSLPVAFRSDRLFVDVTVDGQKQVYLLDDGTPSIDVTAGDDRRLKTPTMLTHAAIGALDVGPLHFENVPVNVEEAGIGILGYDFFTSGVIGIDYSNRRLTWTSRAAFVPPQGAVPLDADFGEALPLIPMTLGKARGDRFVLDFGSFDVVLLRYFTEHDGASLDAVTRNAPRHDIAYLEGGIHSVEAPVSDLMLGHVPIEDAATLIEIPNDGITTDFPIDGIIGVRVLQAFDWWFDAADDRVWYRRR